MRKANGMVLERWRVVRLR